MAKPYRRGQAISKSINFATHSSNIWHKSKSPKHQRLKTVSTTIKEPQFGQRSDVTRRYVNKQPLLSKFNADFMHLFPKVYDH